MKLAERAQRIQCGLASPQDFEGLSTDDILAIKGDQSEMHYRFVGGTHPVETIKAVDEGAQARFRHVASDESTDSMGDIIQVAGWELDRFQKNPVLLWAHDQRNLPIGTVDKVWKGRSAGTRALLTESAFHSEELNPHAELVRGLVEAGALPGVSVGFIPKEFVFPKSEEERKSMGLGELGVLHVKQELLELSVVPVPANGNALRKKMIDRADGVFTRALEAGYEAELVELVKHALNLSDVGEREIRRRTIIVPDGACAKRVEPVRIPAELEAAAKREQGSPSIQGHHSEPAFMDAVAKLTASVDALTENLTKNGTVATAAAEETPVDETSHEPAGPGETFALMVAKGAAEQFKTD